MLFGKLFPFNFVFLLSPPRLSSFIHPLGFQATSLTCAAGTRIWYWDSDGDGFGKLETPVTAVTSPEGYVADNTDCNDADTSITNEFCSKIYGYDFLGNGMCNDASGRIYDSITYAGAGDNAYTVERCADTCNLCFCDENIIAMPNIFYAGLQLYVDTSSTDCQCLVARPDSEISIGYLVSIWQTCNATLIMGAAGPSGAAQDPIEDLSPSSFWSCYAVSLIDNSPSYLSFCAYLTILLLVDQQLWRFPMFPCESAG